MLESTDAPQVDESRRHTRQLGIGVTLRIAVQTRYAWTPQTDAYWRLMGLDQLCHGLTYIFIVRLLSG